MSDDRTEIIEYISSRFAVEDEILKQVLIDQQAGGGPMMNIGPDQGKFLYLLTKLYKPKTILEVGSYYGYSSIWFARALESLTQGKLTCLEIDKKQCDYISQLMQKAQLENYSEIINGSGPDAMQKMIDEGKSFDMIFVDADKSNYSNYMDLAWQLLPKDGLLLVDNTIWSEKVLNTQDPDKSTKAIQGFNDKLAASDKFEATIVTVQDGLALAIKN